MRVQAGQVDAVLLVQLHIDVQRLDQPSLVERGEYLAKAADCSWTTARELLVMYAANRNLQADDITLAFERYRKLSAKTARNIVTFYEKRLKLRVQADAKRKKRRAPKGREASGEDVVEFVPSPSISPA